MLDKKNSGQKNKKRQIKGMIGGARPTQINHKIKKSIDMSIHGFDSIFDDYNEELQKCLNKYSERYPEVAKEYASFNSTIEKYNIQKYKPGDGFYEWHCERNTGCFGKRCLVFMTYLNDVTEGGTEFKYQKLKTAAKCGLTL